MFKLNDNNNTYSLAFADNLIDEMRNYPVQRNNRQFSIKNIDIKYLGVNLDEMLKMSQHVNGQIQKTKNIFKNLHRFFYSPYLDKKTKIIAYLRLLRPIISYACPIWWNISASYMEKLRTFERKCLKSQRTDIFIIKLIRNHIKSAINNTNNRLIKGPFFPKDSYILNALSKGFVPPEAFLFLDLNKQIVNETGIPILYHTSRNLFNKKIHMNTHTEDTSNLVYNYDISKIDKSLMKNFNYFDKKKNK
ncbi:hypothetical protein TSAR_001059 [Trichomalopsis sarcophagae]|uniref:Reverse transcriptase domain-containing protein n=1 Tax=Trichomalopsis sarcophagae TaxID=543379 RepID=A0A232FGK2_9HYME|nr:hypothetical protein TSAR_001059 [Trichomalopsis sarcophagae]